MSNGDWIFIPTASPESSYVLQAPAADDPENAVALASTVIMAGTHANRPAAGAAYNGSLYLETDANGGTLFRCDGTDWVQTALGVTEIAAGAVPSGPAGGDLSGDYPGPTVEQASGAFALTGVLTPPQITADQDNYDPTGLDVSSVLRLRSDASHSITGLAGGTIPWRLMVLENVGSNDLVLIAESSSSAAANRFALAQDLILGANNSALLQYDLTTSRWRLVASSVGSGGGGGSPTGPAGGGLEGTYPNPGLSPALLLLASDANAPNAVIVGTSVITSGTHASRPTAGTAGRLYLETDTDSGTLFLDTGSSWVQCALGVSAEAVSAASAPPVGSAGGGLAGAYPSPTLSPAVILTAADANAPNALVLGNAIIMAGTHAARPAAGTGGRLYLETDTNGGTMFRDNGSSWVQASLGVSASAPPSGSAGGALGGSYPNPTLGPAVVLPASDANAPNAQVLGTDVILAGTLASRPAAATNGRLYFATDANGGTLYRDTGSAWVQAAAPVSVPDTSITGGNWKVLYTNSSGAVTELAVGTAGTVLTSAGASSAPSFATPKAPLVAYAPSDQVVTNSAALTNDTALSLTLSASTTYVLSGWVAFIISATGQGVKADFGGGSATATNFLISTIVTDITTQVMLPTGGNSLTFLFVDVAVQNRILAIWINGAIEVNAGGTFTLRFAQQTATAGQSVTRLRGSWLQALAL